MMTKKVNIYPTRPIITVNPPIRSTVKGVTKPVADIRSCILARAIVEEIMEDGNVINLDLNNYDKDNALVKEVNIPEVASEPVLESQPSISTDTYTEKEYKIEMEVPVVEEPQPEEEESEATLQLSDTITISDSVEITDTAHTEEVATPEQQKRPQQYQKNNKNKRK